jgi:hypothetical protein
MKNLKVEKKLPEIAFIHGVKKGDIFASYTGYEQSNVDYFQVVDLKGTKMVVLKEIASEITGDDGRTMTGFAVAIKDKFLTGEAYSRKIGYQNRVKIDKFRRASPWHGNKDRVSSYA